MSALDITRRTFLKIASAVSLLSLAGCMNGQIGVGGVMVYKRSGRGIKGISNAAKKHNANFLYTTEAAAMANPAHKGDHSSVKTLIIASTRFQELFGDGSDTADLRKFA